MFLRANSRAACLVYQDQPLEAQYVAAFDDDQIVARADRRDGEDRVFMRPADDRSEDDFETLAAS